MPNFPDSLDPAGTATRSGVPYLMLMQQVLDQLNAIQIKVGTTQSPDASSLDYKGSNVGATLDLILSRLDMITTGLLFLGIDITEFDIN